MSIIYYPRDAYILYVQSLSNDRTEICSDQEILKKQKWTLKVEPFSGALRTYYLSVGAKRELYVRVCVYRTCVCVYVCVRVCVCVCVCVTINTVCMWALAQTNENKNFLAFKFSKQGIMNVYIALDIEGTMDGCVHIHMGLWCFLL